jgi:shikimate dehydrogenase
VRGSISGRTRVAGVVGSPISHSLSPRLHNAWLKAAEIDGVYVPFAPNPARFAAFVEGLRGGAIAGLNVTAPFKEQALALADHAYPLAQKAGAANVLVFHNDGKIEADNTDGQGLMGAFAIQAPGHDLLGRPVAILGAGGAARGAAAALLEAGARDIHFLSRNLDRAADLAASFPGLTASAGPAAIRSLVQRLGSLINATPAGLEAALAVGLELGDLRADVVVMDMVYQPLLTPLLQASRALGFTIVDGLEMLIAQARPSFSAFFGAAPPAMDIRAAALAS